MARRPKKKGKGKPKVITLSRSIDPVEISMVWIAVGPPPPPPQMFMLKVTVEATIVPPSFPPSCQFVSKRAKLQKMSGGNWVDITQDKDLNLISGDIYGCTFDVPDNIVAPGDTIQAVVCVMWQAIFPDPDNCADSDDETVPPKP